jgi:hypothetical protein
VIEWSPIVGFVLSQLMRSKDGAESKGFTNSWWAKGFLLCTTSFKADLSLTPRGSLLRGHGI